MRVRLRVGISSERVQQQSTAMLSETRFAARIEIGSSRNRYQRRCLDLFLGKVIDGGSLLLHAPSHDSSVLSGLDDLGNGPDASGLTHVEPTRGFFIGRELVGVEDSAGSHQSGVSVLLEPLRALLGTATAGSEHGLVLVDTVLRGLALLDGLLLLELSGLVVGGGGETDGLPDGGDLGWSEVGLADEGKVDIEAGKVQEASDLVGLLGGAVHSESKTVLVEACLEGGLGDDLLSTPKVIEAESGSFEETEICVFWNAWQMGAVVSASRDVPKQVQQQNGVVSETSK